MTARTGRSERSERAALPGRRWTGRDWLPGTTPPLIIEPIWAVFIAAAADMAAESTYNTLIRFYL